MKDMSFIFDHVFNSFLINLYSCFRSSSACGSRSWATATIVSQVSGKEKRGANVLRNGENLRPIPNIGGF